MQGISLTRLNSILLLVLLTCAILYFGKPFLVPLFFSIMLCMLLTPVCTWLENHGFSRVWATFMGILIIVLFVAGIIGIIGAQANALSEDFPKMQERATAFLNSIQHWIEQRYHIAPGEQIEYAKKGVKSLSEGGSSALSGIFSSLGSFFTGLVLVLLYFFFLMWKREKFVEFIIRLTEPQNREQVRSELAEIRKVASGYLIGRLVSMIFLATIYMIGFSIIGLPNGLLLALIAVVPTIVPYVGAFIGGFFPLAISLISGSADMVWPVVVILVVAQIIDNNVIEPLVEGESLDISPIFTIISLMLGELLWGIPGMILFMPLFAIIKIVCDNIPSLSPYAFLLENEVEPPKWIRSVKKVLKK